MTQRMIVVWADGMPLKVAVEDREKADSNPETLLSGPERARHEFAAAVQQATVLTPLSDVLRHRVQARTRVCADCGNEGDVIHRLRTTPVREDRELVILCESCHRARHAAVAGPVLEAARDAAGKGLSEATVHVSNDFKKRAPWPPRAPEDEDRLNG
jgi:hypothetical protein